jgi:2-polyprenyl-3-methyl-5-hydroxy-6-metoxy-1,4-benzoquinol methylase
VTPDPSHDFYERIADRFEGLDHPDDLRRRLSAVFDEYLAGVRLSGKLTLDAGCGYGPFSEAAARRGAAVVSVDIGERLVALASARAASRGVVADARCLAFRDESFDVVISSEMVEHTDSPERVIAELARVTRRGGLFVLTTPNRAWQWPVRVASRFGLRPFRGLENFVDWRRLESLCAVAGLEVVAHRGLHPWPFHIGFQNTARYVERCLARGPMARLMVNQALVARKVPWPDPQRRPP